MTRSVLFVACSNKDIRILKGVSLSCSFIVSELTATSLAGGAKTSARREEEEAGDSGEAH